MRAVLRIPFDPAEERDHIIGLAALGLQTADDDFLTIIEPLNLVVGKPVSAPHTLDLMDLACVVMGFESFLCIHHKGVSFLGCS